MLRIKAVVYYDQEFYAPWAMRFARSPDARVHVVVSGRCVVTSNGETTALTPNDAVLFTGGDEHVVSDGSTTAARDSREVFAEAVQGRRGTGRSGPVVRLMSGHLEFDGAARRMLFASVPRVIRTSIAESPAGDVQALREQLTRELHAKSPGGDAIVRRIAEILIVRLVRRHLGSQLLTEGMLAALADARLHAAVAMMHARFEESLTLAELASAAGMSRSAFAAHFRRVALVPAMTYLSNWRLLRGRELLSDRGLTVADVAAACGHRSTEGFSRAFKRAYGVSPARLRSTGSATSD